MKPSAIANVAVLIATALAPAAGAQGLGQIDFPTSGAAAAQPAFVRGALLLHSFEYDAAREAFREAQAADPSFAMAYWGEAMTHNHPLWRQASPEAARAALARLGPTSEARLAKAPTPRERDFLQSLEALFGPGDKPARDRAYAEALGGMRERYPDDLEVASFHALALLGTRQDSRDVAVAMRAAAIAEAVVARNPRHPGAAHYLIHAYDDPVHAPLGLRHADAYAGLAPATPHALHIPTHIHVALGLWDEASQLNERSAKAAEERAARTSAAVDEENNLRARRWLAYSYTQQGRYDEAREVLGHIASIASRSGSAGAKGHLALARSAWLVEARRWTDAKPPSSAVDTGREAAAAELFAVGLAALKSGDRMGANTALQQMAGLAEDALAPAPAGPGGRPQPGVAVVADLADRGTAAAVMAQQLEAALLFVEGRREEALVLARQAAVVADGLSFVPGPPLPVKPAHELVGEMLMDLRRPKEAVAAFEASLARMPRRALSLLGLARAATAARDVPTARRAWTDLARVWARADKDLPELKELPRPPS